MTTATMRQDKFRLLCWPAALWIAYELLWYEQFKLTGTPAMAGCTAKLA